MTVFVKAADVAIEITSRLAGILVANGHESDIGSTVHRGKRKLPMEDEVPCCILIEGADEIEDTAGRSQTALVKVRQTYYIDAFSACDPDNPNDAAHAMIRDIKRVLFKGGRTFDGKVAEVSYLGRDIGPRPDGVALVQARVMIDVSFAEDLANP
jgi:hypothetical protein